MSITVKHKAVKKPKDKLYATEWNDDHNTVINSIDRDMILDFFKNPFWNNILDKPDIFIPSVHGSNKHDATVGLGLPYLFPVKAAISSTIGYVANYVRLVPVFIPRPLITDKIGIWIQQPSLNKHLRMGIYADNGETPTGGTLLFQSDSITSGGVAFMLWCNIVGDLALDKGIIWIGISVDDAAFQTFGSLTGSIFGNMLDSCYYNLGSWIPFISPCPAVIRDVTRNPFSILHVKISS